MAHRHKWNVGDIPKITVTFRDPISELPTNPAVVTLVVKRPGGALSTYTYGASAIENPSTGVFKFPLALTTPGTHRWRWIGGNGVDAGAAEEGTLDAVNSF